jgi:hypothetical protein
MQKLSEKPIGKSTTQLLFIPPPLLCSNQNAPGFVQIFVLLLALLSHPEHMHGSATDAIVWSSALPMSYSKHPNLPKPSTALWIKIGLWTDGELGI